MRWTNASLQPAKAATRWALPPFLFLLIASIHQHMVVAAIAPPTNKPQQPSPFVVVLDPAHGGTDNGAHLPDGTAEKDFTLSLAAHLRTLLEGRGFTVVITRSAATAGQDAPDVTADERATLANHAHAQACLILHATAIGNGIHLFNSSLAPLDNAHTARFTPWETAQAGSVTRSIQLAAELNAAFERSGIPVTVGRTYLRPMDNMTCPAVAVEVAPLTPKDSHDRKGPDDAAYFEQVAETLALSLDQWRIHTVNTAPPPLTTRGKN